MNDYNAYITAVNKIFDYISKMRAGWNGKDNISYIDSIEEYKQLVINTLNTFKNTPNVEPTQEIEQHTTEEEVKKD